MGLSHRPVTDNSDPNLIAGHVCRTGKGHRVPPSYDATSVGRGLDSPDRALSTTLWHSAMSRKASRPEVTGSDRTCHSFIEGDEL